MTTTTKLQLTIPTGADSTTVANLWKIDAAFSALTLAADGSAYVNAANKVILQPQEADSGGSGGGGEVEFGSASNTLLLARCFGPFRVTSAVLSSSTEAYTTTLVGHQGIASSFAYTMPQASATQPFQMLCSDAAAPTAQSFVFKSFGQTRPMVHTSAATLAMTVNSSRCNRFSHTAGCAVALPLAASLPDEEFVFLGACVLTCAGLEVVDSSATLTLSAGQRAIIKSDGTQWWRIS